MVFWQKYFESKDRSEPLGCAQSDCRSEKVVATSRVLECRKIHIFMTKLSFNSAEDRNGTQRKIVLGTTESVDYELCRLSNESTHVFMVDRSAGNSLSESTIS